MTTDFRLVTHTTQRYAQIFAVKRSCNGTNNGRFAHPWRANKTQNWAIEFACELHHCQKLNDTILDLFQAVVIFVQNLARKHQVLVILRLGYPGHFAKPIDVVADYRCIGACWGHLGKAVEFACGLFCHLFRHARLLDFVKILLLFVGIFAKFGRDCSHLLTKVVFLLACFHLLFNTVGNALFRLNKLNLTNCVGANFFHADVDVGLFQNVLTTWKHCYNFVCYNVCKGQVVDVLGCHWLDINLQAWLCFCKALYVLDGLFVQSIAGCIVVADVVNCFHIRQKQVVAGCKTCDFCALDCASSYCHGLFRCIVYGNNLANNTHSVQILRTLWIGTCRVKLAHHKKSSAIFDGKTDGIYGNCTCHFNFCSNVWEEEISTHCNYGKVSKISQSSYLSWSIYL